MRALVWLLVAAAPLAAQELRLYSEFQRPDPSGAIAVPDRGAPPREILSPAVARNAWTSFWLVCGVPEGAAATLYIQQNPEILEATLYRAWFTKTAEGWVPDTLERVGLPYVIQFPPDTPAAAGQRTAVFWLDIWVPASVPPERMRFEVNMFVQDRWLIYPMEVRIAEAVVPGVHTGSGPLPPPDVRADAALRAVVATALCGEPEKGRPHADGIPARRLLRRNAQQDVALAKALGMVDPQWCRQVANPAGHPAEWWLSVRGRLYRKAP